MRVVVCTVEGRDALVFTAPSPTHHNHCHHHHHTTLNHHLPPPLTTTTYHHQNHHTPLHFQPPLATTTTTIATTATLYFSSDSPIHAARPRAISCHPHRHDMISYFTSHPLSPNIPRLAGCIPPPGQAPWPIGNVYAVPSDLTMTSQSSYVGHSSERSLACSPACQLLFQFRGFVSS